jgi:rhodanese-related sulfurtransferase
MLYKRSLQGLILSLLAALQLSACTPPAAQVGLTEPPAPDLPVTVRELTPDEAQAMITSVPGLVIVDVRTEGEAKADGKLPGAQIYDYLHGEDMIKRLEELDRDSRVLVYCAIGGRAKLTAARMSAMGFTHLSLLKGGLNAWIAAGKPVEQ